MPGCLLLSAALAFLPQDARAAHDVAASLVARHTPRDAGTAEGRGAADFLVRAARRTGARVRLDVFDADTPRGWLRLANVVAEFGDAAAEDRVVLLSHYDTKAGSDCPGANDGASTSGLLVALGHVLARAGAEVPPVTLVWTDGEECFEAYGPRDGLWGSRRAAAELAASGRRVRAAICLDMLGDAELSVAVPANGSPALREVAVRAAAKAGRSSSLHLSEMCVRDDHVPFLERGWPAVDLIDFDYGPTNAYWHTAADAMERVSEDSLLKSGEIVAEMLNILL